ncbi:MAG TPA: DUF3857 domain-containing protein [Chitinophagaceae bacterium]|nr:DUF3857 domain-containing protein [Chitinophagaceae bacterium]
MKILSHLMLAILLSFSACAQDNVSIKLGNISPESFSIETSPVMDSNTNAVILTDVGSTEFIGNDHRWFSYVYKRRARIKIISDKGMDISTVKIHLYGKAANKDKLTEVKAATYNLERGKVVATELNPSDIFEDRLSSYASVTKFTLPSVKAGSIIEYSYTITSYYYTSLPTWSFQDEQYPCLYSEYKVVFPAALRYVIVRSGMDSFFTSKTSTVKNNHYYMANVTVTSNDIMNIWAMKDVPAFTSESFINSPSDYLDKIEFVLGQTYNGEELTDHGTSWEAVTKELLVEEDFGMAIDKDQSSNLFNTADKVTSHSINLAESAHQLFYYVRDNFACIPDDDIFLGSDLYTVNKKKKGSVAELNLLLIALLRQKGIPADPVILSTRDYGKNSAEYPRLDQMNYVICMARLGRDSVYLDASRHNLGFGKLSLDCYNGHARLISDKGTSLYFSPEEIKEQKTTNVIVFNDQQGSLEGSVSTSVGAFGSEQLRDEIKTNGKEKYLEYIKSGLTNEFNISQVGVDSLQEPEFPATVHYDIKLPVSGDIVYFTPVVTSDYLKNPFGSLQRKYPVTLPYPIDNIYLLTMEIPNGYSVDELPKPARVSYNGDEGFFEYLIQKDDNRIQFRSRLKLNKASFAAEDYNSLRDFFAFVIKKYGEQIVFKKK